MTSYPVALGEMTCFEWWVDSNCRAQLPTDKTTQLPTDKTTWPSGSAPIIYAHFQLGATGNNYVSRFTNEACPTCPVLTPSKLVYVGEKEHVRGLKRAKQYSWLQAGSWMYTVYWRLLDKAFEQPDFRKTLEALIYNDLFQRFQSNPKVLVHNHGMQFKSKHSGDKRLVVYRYEILKQLAQIGI